MNRKTIGIIYGVLVTPPALFLAMLSTGAGHGDYLAARLLFPAPMLTTHLFGQISAPALLLAIVQFPVYGFLIGASCESGRSKLWLAVIAYHSGMLALLFGFPDLPFS
jgi:hypothetical protein